MLLKFLFSNDIKKINLNQKCFLLGNNANLASGILHTFITSRTLNWYSRDYEDGRRDVPSKMWEMHEVGELRDRTVLQPYIFILTTTFQNRCDAKRPFHTTNETLTLLRMIKLDATKEHTCKIDDLIGQELPLFGQLRHAPFPRLQHSNLEMGLLRERTSNEHRFISLRR